MKSTIALLSLLAACALAGCQPDLGPAPPGAQAGDDDHVGSVSSASHFLSQQPLEDAVWTCNTANPSMPRPHLTETSSPRMRLMWMPLGGGPWNKITLIYQTNGAIWQLSSQWQPSRAGGSTSWSLEFTPTDWDASAYWWVTTPLGATCPGMPPSGWYSPIYHWYLDAVYSSEGSSYPVLIQPYIEIRAHSDFDYVNHSWQTTNGTSWVKLY
jgi:hypothetical protein